MDLDDRGIAQATVQQVGVHLLYMSGRKHLQGNTPDVRDNVSSDIRLVAVLGSQGGISGGVGFQPTVHKLRDCFFVPWHISAILYSRKAFP